jgi:ferritin-like metal-binding protein YciE
VQQLDSLSDVLVSQIADLQSAEQQLVSALVQMAGAASNQQLREAFQIHLEQTRTHADRLTRVPACSRPTCPARRARL